MLEVSITIINEDAAILGASFIVKDLEINAVAFGFEARHNAVAGSNTMSVVT